MRRARVSVGGAVVCLILAGFVGPLLAWLLIMTCFGLILDGATAWFERAGSTGGLREYKQ